MGVADIIAYTFFVYLKCFLKGFGSWTCVFDAVRWESGLRDPGRGERRAGSRRARPPAGSPPLVDAS